MPGLDSVTKNRDVVFMDFMKIIESLDEALYTVMGWLVFYPMTLWRALVRPLKMMAYADREVSDKPEDQYDDAIRPPLFLFLTLLISHGIEAAVAGQNPLLSDRHGLAALVDSDLALLALRMILFSLFPLMMSVRLLRRQSVRLTHPNLRRPFYGQCFTAAPFALLIGIGTLLTTAPLPDGHITGAIVVIFAIGWYLSVQSLWFSRKLHISFVAGLGQALVSTCLATIMFVAIALMIV
ncbi:hypothetical protein [Sphingobium algorifonticola]|uniref:Permease n=1 Tax=Sphingobium algorifonticola TaxID=2008318 RepID=A0A437JA02_9SPHN|nr:hypothetical protein [Sphingobium algorifonticola]RVT42132.1 hypothetical protein ENE74_07875 [Sphingobium algorifonticola]